MSASDAAPLPRLGEVFFDVRGSSRSLRLSWYADTGVAVFSIWQGGMCTGTFRLPIGDLPRIIEILERGPDDGRSRARPEPRMTGTGQREAPPPPRRLHHPDPEGRYPEEPRTGYSQVDAAETAAVSFFSGDQRRSHEDPAPPGRGGYGPDEAPGPRSLGREPDVYPPPGGGSYGRGDYAGDPYRAYQPSAPAEHDSATHRGDDDGFGQERFVPPYVRGAVGEYPSDIPPGPAGRPDDPMQSAYRGDPLAGPSSEPDYLQQPWPPPGYSDGSQYRLADQQPGPEDGSAAWHSPGRHGRYPPPADAAGEQPDLDPQPDIDALPRDYPAWGGR